MAAHIDSCDEDEEIARKLQIEFEAEDQYTMEQEDNDFKLAVSLATHEVSDSSSSASLQSLSVSDQEAGDTSVKKGESKNKFILKEKSLTASSFHNISDSESSNTSSPRIVSDTKKEKEEKLKKKMIGTLVSAYQNSLKSTPKVQQHSKTETKQKKTISSSLHEISDSSDSDVASPEILLTSHQKTNKASGSKQNTLSSKFVPQILGSRPKIRQIAKTAAIPCYPSSKSIVTHDLSDSDSDRDIGLKKSRILNAQTSVNVNITDKNERDLSSTHSKDLKRSISDNSSRNSFGKISTSKSPSFPSTSTSSPNIFNKNGSQNSDKNSVKHPKNKNILLKDNAPIPKADDVRPLCPYSSECYRKNPAHFEEYQHTDNEPILKKKANESPSGPPAKKGTKNLKKNIFKTIQLQNSHNFLLTTVTGISADYNSSMAITIQDLLSVNMGNLEASVQFNYMFDIPWLMKQYPPEFRNKPVLIVHGEQRQDKLSLMQSGIAFPNVKFCQAKLEILYGTHHTKMMFLLYDTGMRVIIHTANIVEGDWFQKTQGVWVSPLFPRIKEGSSSKGDSETKFKTNLLEYTSSYHSSELNPWIKYIEEHDMSKARVYIIASSPGRHIGMRKNSFGHLKLRKVLSEYGPSGKLDPRCHLIGQFSSIGSLGANKDQWLCKEFLTSLSARRQNSDLLQKPQMHLIFPSRENVRLSLEGYPGGGSLPYSIKTAKKQLYLNDFLHHWKSESRGRSQALPHIKTYALFPPDYSQLAWFLVTSANLSKAAWGALEKNGSQLMIRSYELGVLFLPQHFNSGDMFQLVENYMLEDTSKEVLGFPLPYDVPPQPYSKSDLPWMWDVPCVDKPDSHGMKWCPPV